MAEFLDTYPLALPFVIFFGRLCDVPLSTVRIMFIARGDRKLAPIIGFVEVFIWIVVISQVLSRANNMASYLSYAGGFAAGTYLGVLMEEYFALGFYKYTIYIKNNGAELIKICNRYKIGATIFHAEGYRSPTTVIETIINRKHRNVIEKIIHEFDAQAFVVVEEIRDKTFGIFNVRKTPVPVEQDE